MVNYKYWRRKQRATNSNLCDIYQVTGEMMGEASSPYITIEVILGEKQEGIHKATKGILKVYSATYLEYKYGKIGTEVLSVPIVSGGIESVNGQDVVYTPAPKGVYKNRKVTTAGKGSGNSDLSNRQHGGSENIIVRLFGGILIHQGNNGVTQEGAYTQGCIAITAYKLNMDEDTGQTDVDRNYQEFSEIVKNGANIDVIIK